MLYTCVEQVHNNMVGVTLASVFWKTPFFYVLACSTSRLIMQYTTMVCVTFGDLHVLTTFMNNEQCHLASSHVTHL